MQALPQALQIGRRRDARRRGRSSISRSPSPPRRASSATGTPRPPSTTRSPTTPSSPPPARRRSGDADPLELGRHPRRHRRRLHALRLGLLHRLRRRRGQAARQDDHEGAVDGGGGARPALHLGAARARPHRRLQLPAGGRLPGLLGRRPRATHCRTRRATCRSPPRLRGEPGDRGHRRAHLHGHADLADHGLPDGASAACSPGAWTAWGPSGSPHQPALGFAGRYVRVLAGLSAFISSPTGISSRACSQVWWPPACRSSRSSP